MKKRSLLKTMLLLCALVAGSSSVWGQETTTYTLQLSADKKISTSGLTDGSVVWTATNNDATISNSYVTDYSGEQFGTGSTTGNVVLSTSSISGTITKVAVTSQTGTGGGATVAVSVGGISWGSQNMKVATKSDKTPEVLNFTKSGNGSGTIQITLTQTVSKAMYLNKIEITYIPVVETKVATPKISLDEGLYYGTKSVTLSTTTAGAKIYYTTNGDNPTSNSAEYTEAISVSATQTIKAIGIKEGLEDSEITTAEYTIINSIPARNPKNIGSNYFVKVTSLDDLEDGDAILIVNQLGNKVMAGQNTKNHYREEVSVISSAGVINYLPTNAQKLVIIKTGNRLFFSTDATSYLYANSSTSNTIETNNEATAGANALASIEIATNGDATIVFLGNNTRNSLRHNTSNTRFSCYADGQEAVHIYKEIQAPTTATISTLANRNFGSYITTQKLDFSQAEGITAYIATGFNSGKTAIVLEEVDVVPANTPIIVKTTTQGATVNVPVTTEDASDISANKLVAGDGTTAYNKPDGYTYYYLKQDQFYKATSGTLQNGKAYFKVLTSEVPANAPALGFDLGEGTTAIDGVRSQTEEVREGIFDLSGRRVANPTKGLYIVNGKKVIIK